MPLDNLSEGANKHSAPESSLSLLAVSSAESGKPFKLQTEDIASALAFGASYSASSTTSVLLRDRVLSTLPDHRSSSLQWFEKNASGVQREVFAQQKFALEPAVAAVKRADVFNTILYDDFAKTRESLNSHLAVTKHRLRFFGNASGQALQGEASSLLRAATAGPDHALAATTRAVLRPGSHIAEKETVGALWSYRRLLAAGGYDTPRANQLRQTIIEGATKLEAQGLSPALKGAEVLALRQRQQVLEQFIKGPLPSKEAVLATVGTTEEVVRGQKLFVSASAEGRALTHFATKVEAATTTGAELSMAERALVAEHRQSIAGLAGKPDAIGAMAGRKFLTGFGLATLSTAGGYAFDHALAKELGIEIKDTDQSNRTRLAVDGCLVPAFLLSELPAKLRIPLAVGAFGAGRASTFTSADNIMSPRAAELLKPNHADTVLLGLSIMAPLSGRYKALAMTGSLAAGRVVNLF